MSTDSLLYVVLLGASLALAALGWASYLLCALRLSRARNADRHRTPGGAPRSSSDLETGKPRYSWVPGAELAVDARPEDAPPDESDVVRISPPARAAIFRPDREEPSAAAGFLEDVLDEGMEKVQGREPSEDRPAWL